MGELIGIIVRIDEVVSFLIFNFDASLLWLSTVYFLISMKILLDGQIMSISKKWFLLRFISLFFVFGHELLNFLRISDELGSRGNLVHLPDDDFEFANSGLI